MTGLDATVDGVPHLINRLKGFEPEVYKILQSEVRTAADLIGASARGMIPSDAPTSHWAASGRMAWTSGTVRGSLKPGFRTKNVGGTRAVSAVVRSTSAPYALWAVSGSNDNGRLGSLLNASFGRTFPRALGSAWTMHVDAAREEIKQAVHRAAERLTSG